MQQIYRRTSIPKCDFNRVDMIPRVSKTSLLSNKSLSTLNKIEFKSQPILVFGSL